MTHLPQLCALSLPRTKMSRCLLALLGLAFLQVGSQARADAAPSVTPGPAAFIDPTTRQPWRYARIGGFEVYSALPDKITEAYMNRVFAGISLPNLPPAFQAGDVLPIQIILHLGLPETSLAPKQGDPGLYAFNADKGFSRSYSVADDDYFWTRVRIDTQNPDATDGDWVSNLSYSSIIPYLVQRHTPRPPRWLSAGLERAWRADPVGYVGDNYLELEQKSVRLVELEDAINHPERLIPLERFFNELAPTEDAPEYERWSAQAELFVRWGVLAEAGKNARNFWRFAEAASRGKVSRELFKGSFRLDYDQVSGRLARYLSHPEKSFLAFSPGPARRVLALRNASAAEIGRVEGEWVDAVAANLSAFPGQKKNLQRYAGQRMEEAYATGDRDPRLLASLGLHYVDQKDPKKARPLLAEATARDVARPRAYVELAWLKLQEAKQRSGGALTYEQLIEVLTPLYKTRSLLPPPRLAYHLMAEIWESTAVRPSPEAFAVLAEGVEHYPREPALALRIARLGQTYGYKKEAITLLDHALEFPMVADEQFKLRDFRGMLKLAESK